MGFWRTLGSKSVSEQGEQGGPEIETHNKESRTSSHWSWQINIAGENIGPEPDHWETQNETREHLGTYPLIPKWLMINFPASFKCLHTDCKIPNHTVNNILMGYFSCESNC